MIPTLVIIKLITVDCNLTIAQYININVELSSSPLKICIKGKVFQNVFPFLHI